MKVFLRDYLTSPTVVPKDTETPLKGRAVFIRLANGAEIEVEENDGLLVLRAWNAQLAVAPGQAVNVVRIEPQGVMKGRGPGIPYHVKKARGRKA